jgi:hypothetical protein
VFYVVIGCQQNKREDEKYDYPGRNDPMALLIMGMSNLFLK